MYFSSGVLCQKRGKKQTIILTQFTLVSNQVFVRTERKIKTFSVAKATLE